jgi:quaternary ammonium compound-resistance protein SugE
MIDTRAWMLLVAAGVLEVGWAVGLRYTEGFTRLVPSTLTIGTMVASMYLLAQAVRTIPVGTGYAVWTGIGAVGTAIFGIAVLGEPRHAARIVSLLLIVVGILGLKLSSRT